MSGNLIIDVSGRGSQAPSRLRNLGYSAVEEAQVISHIGYVSRIYQPPDLPSDWHVLGIYATPLTGKRTGAILNIEENQWLVTLMGYAHDYPLVDEVGFLDSH